MRASAVLVASVNELTLVTANVKDFTRFKGVDVENWFKRRGCHYRAGMSVAEVQRPIEERK